MSYLQDGKVRFGVIMRPEIVEAARSLTLTWYYEWLPDGRMTLRGINPRTLSDAMVHFMEIGMEVSLERMEPCLREATQTFHAWQAVMAFFDATPDADQMFINDVSRASPARRLLEGMVDIDPGTGRVRGITREEAEREMEGARVAFSGRTNASAALRHALAASE